ncbi:restriction endonuclease-related protein [Pseudomonas sp. TE3610]
MTADKLESNLQLPVEDWLHEAIRGDLKGPLLVSSNAPTPMCSEMLLEFNAFEQLNRTQRLVQRVRDSCKVLADGDELYRAFRFFLVNNPITDHRPARLLFQPLNLSLDDCYRPPASHELLGGYLYLCPSCGWPLNVSQANIACPARWCEEAGSIFDRAVDYRVINRVDGSELQGLPGQGMLVLQEAFWKFTLLPGLLELKLAEGLRALGYSPVLWPNVDQADVRVSVDGEPLDLDAKVWRYPEVLRRHLGSVPRSNRRWIVIPDYQSASLSYLREKLGVNVYTYSGCLKVLKKAVG